MAARGPGEHPWSGVTPTPDDGRRLSPRQAWDESARPVLTWPGSGAGSLGGPGGATGSSEERDPYTEEGRREAQQLIDIHDHLRQELRRLRDLGAQVLAGQLPPGAARSAIAVMTMRQNSWTLGGYCQSYCRVVALHHTIEDQAVFPRLRAAAPRAGVVVDRLEQEHHVIAGVLDEVDAALVALVGDVDHPTAMTAVQDAVDLLSDALLSHLSYEENELVEPLARFGGVM